MKLIWATVLFVTGCAVPADGVFGETPGERFRSYMARLDADCKKAGLGPYRLSDASSLLRSDASCDILLLKPRDWNEAKFVKVDGQPLPIPDEWVATEEGRFAHSIRLPNPLLIDSGYRQAMTSEEYFKHLCEKEAGEFIYKTVEAVDGVMQMRRDVRATDNQLKHLYALEDRLMYGLSGERSQDYLVQPPFGQYQFIEMPVNGISKQGTSYTRYSLGRATEKSKTLHLAINGESVAVPYVVEARTVTDPISRYGYLWRGVVRPHDREMGIMGSEILVIDISARQVLAVRRSFQRTDDRAIRAPGIQWAGGNHICPGATDLMLGRFINSVLKPSKRSPSGTQ